jgi:hypothetical protein
MVSKSVKIKKIFLLASVIVALVLGGILFLKHWKPDCADIHKSSDALINRGVNKAEKAYQSLSTNYTYCSKPSSYKADKNAPQKVQAMRYITLLSVAALQSNNPRAAVQYSQKGIDLYNKMSSSEKQISSSGVYSVYFDIGVKKDAGSALGQRNIQLQQ